MSTTIHLIAPFRKIGPPKIAHIGISHPKHWTLDASISLQIQSDRAPRPAFRGGEHGQPPACPSSSCNKVPQKL